MKQAQHLRRHLATLLLLAVTTLTWAYDFEKDGIYYNTNSDGTSVSVTYKGPYSYSGNSYSGSVVIPSTVTYSGTTYSVTSIGEDAFEDCRSLTSVTIPNSVTNIGRTAFSGSTGLTSVTIPNSVTSIGNSAFSICSGLTSVTIPESVTNIDNNAFYGCTGLTKVEFASIESLCKIKFGTSDSNPLYYAKHLYINGQEDEVKDLVIPNSVTSIGDYTFYNCSGLKSITIPESVTDTGSSAFFNCTGLTKAEFASIESLCKINFSGGSDSNPLYYAKHLYVNGQEVKDLVIPNSVTNICDYAFRNSTSLTSVTIPNSVTSIGEKAFNGCSGLTSVTIGNSVTSIGKSAFEDCRSLTSVTIPNSVTSIGRDAFWGCSGLTSIIIDKGNTRYDSRNDCNAIIETETNTLIAGCKNTVIPESVTSIGNSAFEDCTGLTSITIPNSVTSIGKSAFCDCSSLTLVTCHAQNVPGTGTNVFTNTPQSTATLYVPAESIDAYKSTYPWSEFGTILAITPTAVESLTADENSGKDRTDAAIYDLQGRRLNEKPTRGYYIQGSKKHFVK